ncbi:MAG: HAMP domain-containing histidine kinase [Vallitalea sp.]|jgi:signal transduction histidine kinase|nr:HAMP domain-containing histidine kinase [Vallitalea sp.]
MRDFIRDKNIKKYIVELISVYALVFLILIGIDIFSQFIEYEFIVKYKYSIVKLLLLFLAICSSLLGYKILNYIFNKLNTININITQAINGNYNRLMQQNHEYSEGVLYSVDYQLNMLICKLYNNNEFLEDEKKKLNALVTEITHQLKTPVAAIKLFNSLLENDNIKDNEKKDIILRMADEINRVEWFVNSLTDISKLETGLIQLQIKENNISKTIIQAVNSIYISARQKNIEIIMKKITNNYFNFDTKWTQEAVGNILDNAVKYTGDGGTITIECLDSAMSNIIRITDTGRGISEKELPLIFNRFYKSNKEDEGIGVGLYLAKEIMKSQDGTIKVYSEENMGTTFELIFYK